ncbi:MAG TPA: hypothetical protein VMR65_02965 [Candidatus Sulfotelmatobacter sp.]|nr:hypothetical protein [Candidatus Sulfotelmatobacter sp.]
MSALPPEHERARDGATLCLRCGLCCDGTLFSRTELKPGEVETARSLGVSLISIGDAGSATRSAIPQGCSLFRDGCCSSYGRWRPQACGDYVCRLLSGYVGGTRTLAECLEVVRVVREADADARQPASGGLARLRAAGLLEVFRRKFFETESDPGPMGPKDGSVSGSTAP